MHMPPNHPHPTCSRCTDREALGLPSYREIENIPTLVIEGKVWL
jgi:hypothetical protein